MAQPVTKHQRLFGDHLKRRMDQAFANLQTEEIPFLDIEIIPGEIDSLKLRIPISIKEIARELNLNLTEMVNLVLCNFHHEITGKQESLIRLIQSQDQDFIARFTQGLKLSLKEKP